MAFENLRPEYLAINPKGVVPTLRYDGTDIPESSIINEFLDEQYPRPSLEPSEPLERARMRYWIKVEEDELFAGVRPASLNLMMKQAFARHSAADLDRILASHPRPHQVPQLKRMFLDPPDPKAVDQSRRMLGATFAKVERSLCDNGPWLAGKSYSLADIAAAPAIDRIQRLGMSAIWDPLPAVRDWITRVTSRPAYDKAAPPEKYRLPKALTI
jgi:glutathione S-transferase